MEEKPAAKSKIAQLEEVYQEYKNRLEEAEHESTEIVNGAWSKAEALIAEAQKKAQLTAAEIERVAREEAEKILAEARNKADRLNKETEQVIKKAANEKTKAEVEKILTSTREEAARTAAGIIEQSKKEAERIIGGVKEEARAQAENEMAKIVNEAKAVARKVDEESVARASETGKLLIETMQKAENCFSKIRSQMETELNDYALNIAKTKDNLQNRTMLEELHKLSTPGDSKEHKGSGDWKELRIIAPYDELQVKRLIEFLKQIPSLKIAGEGVSEDDYSIYLDVIRPLPLLKLLGGISMVASSDARGDMIKLRLKSDATV
ncbi:MAG: hypothetical protein PHR56_01765 [Dehalococcoidales bacterium]|nr:hypothetical protein [Dehalococcoidales bacterium]